MTNTLTYHRICFFSFLLCSIFFYNNTSIAQELKQYEGEYILNDSLTGNAKLHYFVQDNDTILDGDFQFSNVSKIDEETEKYQSIEYKGTFKKNKKDGDWVFAHKILKPDYNYTIDDLFLSTESNGTASFVYANFHEGVANGEWKLVRYNFEKSKPTDTVHTSQINFNNGRLEGRFVSNSNELRINGSFNDGLIDKTWKFETDDFMQERIFESGVLKNISFEFKDDEDSTAEKINVEFIGFDTTYSKDDSSENWEKIELNDTYYKIFNKSKIKIVQGSKYQHQNKIKESIQHTNDIIGNVFKSITFIDEFSIWNNLRGSTEYESPKVHIRKIEFTEKEKEMISEIQEKYTHSKKTIDSLLSKEKLDIAKLNFKEVNKIESIFEIYSTRLKDIENSIALITSPVFEYLKRDEILEAYRVKIRFPKTVSYNYDGEQLTDDIEFPETETDQYNLEFITELINEIHKDVTTLKDESDKIYEQLRKQESLSENEDILLSTKKEIEDFLNDSDNDDFNEYHDYFSATIKNQLDDILSNYSKMSLEDKKQHIDNYIDCLNSIKEFKDELMEFKELEERIDDEYTRVVFNPYLMSDISERVKEKIYNAYEEYILPYILEDLNDNINCENINQKKENLEIIYNSMLEIIEKDTKEKERELRREKDVNKILSILNIELN